MTCVLQGNPEEAGRWDPWWIWSYSNQDCFGNAIMVKWLVESKQTWTVDLPGGHLRNRRGMRKSQHQR